MKKNIFVKIYCFIVLCVSISQGAFSQIKLPTYDLKFNALPSRWDEAIPLGNGLLGALIWEKDNKLRISLDRSDLWDLRPTSFVNTDEFNYQWVYEQWKNDNYNAVINKFDVPYDKIPAPTKIPAGVIEFDIKKLGEISSVKLVLKNAVCEVQWKNGAKFIMYIDAEKPLGFYQFINTSKKITPQLLPPQYNVKNVDSLQNNVVGGQNLKLLDYDNGLVEKNKNQITYTQKGWGGFKYQISVNSFKTRGNNSSGVWSISANTKNTIDAKRYVSNIKKKDFGIEKKSHTQWWKNFWSASSISLPDKLLEKQWYLEQYKFGASARNDTPPISLQAVWTADNGKLPPWKGDFHHDLNTQLSYWPAYSGNHLDLEEGFINWLWNNKNTFYEYTKNYYNANGINVPGVTTLDGVAMGGWVQYACGPTVGAWLGHHFYLHWRYTMDTQFLKNRAYPWIKDVAIFLDEISTKDNNGYRKLPISSSPEIHNNSRKAWFDKTTNFDLGLIRWTYEKAIELALELKLNEEAKKWKQILDEWPDFDVDQGLTFAPGYPYNQSHRHLSHQIAYHPLGIIDISNGSKHKSIIDDTIKKIDEMGSSQWVGYSFSWLGGLKARALDGEGAAKALSIFATAFCSSNSFHLNGDQTDNNYSSFKYRPFTLEGNFAFASGIQEMLIQSHTKTIRVFPAIPSHWKNVSFSRLRTEGAFIVSAEIVNSKVTTVSITSEMGGHLKLFNPFKNASFKCNYKYILKNNIINATLNTGNTIKFESIK